MKDRKSKLIRNLIRNDNERLPPDADVEYNVIEQTSRAVSSTSDTNATDTASCSSDHWLRYPSQIATKVWINQIKSNWYRPDLERINLGEITDYRSIVFLISPWLVHTCHINVSSFYYKHILQCKNTNK